MNVLIVNDDGIESEGLRILADRVGKLHDVYVLAPDSNRSATSHHIVMFQNLELVRHKKNRWSCTGMPADCACVGIKSRFFNVDFDVVLSGINCGPNLGTDIVFSGTCAGARQAVLNGVPAVAVSLDPVDWQKAKNEGFKYVALADFVASNLEALAELSGKKVPGTFVNINAASRDSYKGVRFAKKLIKRKYEEDIEVLKTESGIFSHFKPHENVSENSENEEEFYGTDYSDVREGYISLSLVYAEPVAADVVDCISFKV